MPDRSIRNINVNHRHQHATTPPTPRRPRSRGRGRLFVVAIIVIVIAAALGVLLSALFAGASVVVTPRTTSVTAPTTIQAALNAPVGTLAFTQTSATLSATTTVPANGTQQVQKPASGVITVSNSFRADPQKLIANTRFQAPDGKIYRIHDSVTVPGMQGSKPGTASVTAYADNPGPDYNRNGTTVYTIPGFKGDPRYAKITGVSGPMTGGFSGAQPTVAKSDLDAAKAQMDTQLDAAVRQALASSIPEGYQLVSGTLTVAFGQLSQTAGSGNQANLSESATASGDLVRTSDLASAIARQTVQGYQGEAVDFADNSNITMTASTTADSSSIMISLGSGQVALLWQFDPNALKQALVGQPKSKFEDIIKQFEPAISKADASVRPFWTSDFPSDPNKITVSVAQQ